MMLNMLNVSRTEIPSIFEKEEEEEKNSVKEMDDPVLSDVPTTKKKQDRSFSLSCHARPRLYISASLLN